MYSKQEKTCNHFTYLLQFFIYFLVSHVWISFLTHVSAQHFKSEHFDCKKQLAFRKSVTDYINVHSKLCLNKSLGVTVQLDTVPTKHIADHTAVQCKIYLKTTLLYSLHYTLIYTIDFT